MGQKRKFQYFTEKNNFALNTFRIFMNIEFDFYITMFIHTKKG